MEEDKTATTEMNEKLIDSFLEITSSSREEASFFLESHRWNLDAAVTTFLDNDAGTAVSDMPATVSNPNRPPSSIAAASPSPTHSPEYSPSETSPSRSRSPSPPSRAAPYSLRSRGASENQVSQNASGSRATRSRQHAGNIRTFTDLNRSPAGGDSDSDEAQEYFTGGEKSGMMVQDPRRARDVDALFDQARQSAVDRPVESSRSASRSFTGASRLLSGETVSSSAQQQQPEQPQMVTHNITFWRNGFTIDDGPLRTFDDPANASFMESIARSECPSELEPADKNIRVHVDLVRREENFTEPPKPKTPFQGVGRTLGASGSSSSSAATQAAPAQMNTAPAPSRGLIVDPVSPTTSVQLRLADGTRLVSRFNNHHTIRDVRGFIDASRPGGSKEYQLLTMGFPPKQLTELDQTIEQAGIANSVVIQKF